QGGQLLADELDRADHCGASPGAALPGTKVRPRACTNGHARSGTLAVARDPRRDSTICLPELRRPLTRAGYAVFARTGGVEVSSEHHNLSGEAVNHITLSL